MQCYLGPLAQVADQPLDGHCTLSALVAYWYHWSVRLSIVVSRVFTVVSDIQTL